MNRNYFHAWAFLFICFGYLCSNPGILAQEVPTEKNKIMKLMENSYIEVMCRGGDPKLLINSFHASFRMYTYYRGEISVRSLDDWILRLEQNRGKSSLNRWNFAMIDVVENTAIVKLEFFVDQQLRYTDYFTLYKLGEEWKVFTKTFSIH